LLVVLIVSGFTKTGELRMADIKMADIKEVGVRRSAAGFGEERD
jgi:hypothetical protein